MQEVHDGYFLTGGKFWNRTIYSGRMMAVLFAAGEPVDAQHA